MKLRTFTGLDKETPCACGCNQKILARPDVQVVVDMDSPKWKRDRYLPGHAGNGYGSSPYGFAAAGVRESDLKNPSRFLDRLLKWA